MANHFHGSIKEKNPKMLKNVVVKRNAFKLYRDSMLTFAKDLPKNLWKRGVHQNGYDYVDLAPFTEFSNVEKAAMLLLPKSKSGKLSNFRLLQMAPGCVVSGHYDLRSEENLKEHTYSLNVVLSPALLGGVLKLNGIEACLTPGDAVLYDASLVFHQITKVYQGFLYMFSAQTRNDA